MERSHLATPCPALRKAERRQTVWRRETEKRQATWRREVGEAADNMDIDDPDIDSDGFVNQTIHCQQGINQAIQDDDEEDWSEDSNDEAAITHS